MRILILKKCREAQPLYAFLDEISAGLRNKIFSKFQSYAEHGDLIHGSSLKSLNSRIWKYNGTIHKLRVDHGKESVRVLFARNSSNDLIILHAFLKSTRKTPKKEARQAIDLYLSLDDLPTEEWTN